MQAANVQARLDTIKARRNYTRADKVPTRGVPNGGSSSQDPIEIDSD